jgi:hypothetical protein
MEKLNYVVVSSTNNIGGSVNDTDMYFPFTGNKNGMKPPKSFAKTKKEIWGYITEDEFSGMDDLTYLGFDGDYYVYADGRGKKFFSNIGKGIVKGVKGAGKGIGSAAKWVGKQIKNLVTKWGKQIQENRTRRQSAKALKKAANVGVAEKKAIAEAEAKKLQGKQKQEFIEREKQKAAQLLEQRHAEVETKIAEAEKKAYDEALARTNNVETAEKAALDKGTEVENQFTGYLDGEDKGFWKSMGVGGKVAIIGGGTLLIGLIIYLVVKNK